METPVFAFWEKGPLRGGGVPVSAEGTLRGFAGIFASVAFEGEFGLWSFPWRYPSKRCPPLRSRALRFITCSTASLAISTSQLKKLVLISYEISLRYNARAWELVTSSSMS